MPLQHVDFDLDLDLDLDGLMRLEFSLGCYRECIEYKNQRVQVEVQVQVHDEAVSQVSACGLEPLDPVGFKTTTTSTRPAFRKSSSVAVSDSQNVGSALDIGGRARYLILSAGVSMTKSYPTRDVHLMRGMAMPMRGPSGLGGTLR